MDYNQRKNAVWANVLKPMTIMMSPPRHLASNEEGKKLYLETLFDAINGQLPPEMEVEEFNHACKTLSKRLIEKTTIRTYYLAADCKTTALSVGQEWLKKKEHLASYENPKKQKEEIKRNKDNPESMGWSLESIAQHKENLRQAIENDELQGTLAQSFRQILDSAEAKILARQETPY